jgi:Protein of unknown function (DUF2637)
MIRPAVSVTAAPQASPADRWISRAADATVAALAGLAGAISYSHMRQLAQDHGQAGWHAHAFPLSVDGLEIVATLVLLSDRRQRRRSGWLPWAALLTGTVGSLAANIATAHPDPTSRIIAGWPALALLIAVKLLSGMLEQRKAGSSHADGGPKNSSGASNASAHLPRRASPRPSSHRVSPSNGSTPPAVPDPGIGALLPAARAAWDDLQRSGHALTRDALAAGLRMHGHPIRNARLTPLMQFLRSEQLTDSPAPDALP